MTYPNITQYRDAMFDVEAFDKLRGLEAVKDSKGMPVFVAGNFAVVFKVIYKGRQYALKCFYSDVADRRKRYAAISDYLGALSSAYFADYTYYEEEVWISPLGMSYPVVLMEWVEGDTLGVYLSRLLGNGLNSVDANVRLEGVYRKFIELSVFLLGSDFAHGDLKHDNIIVTKEGELRLVDYDGMFVPALAGMSACELGGTAYQHPLRKSDFFDARLDDFSIFVISASLLALSLYPSMYSDYNSKDNLLFSRSDYSTLSESVVIKQMYNICDNRLNMLLDKIVAMISLAMPYSTNSLSLISSLQIKSPIPPIKKELPKENTTIAKVNLFPTFYKESLGGGVDIEMIFVEGGTFMMGSPEDEEGRNKNETLHKVRLDSFYIGKYPVTQKQWQAIMGYNPSKFKGDNHPVESVSWDDAQEFVKELNAKTGKNYRLPTEAEWEYACRGGNKSKGYKYSGSDNIDEVAWYSDNSGGQTHSVGQKKPNELGIYDMSGNVYEYCNDWFGKDYYANSIEYNPKGPESGSRRVLRGGSWISLATICRSANRHDSPDIRFYYNGLRLVLSSK